MVLDELAESVSDSETCRITDGKLTAACAKGWLTPREYISMASVALFGFGSGLAGMG